MIDSRGLRGAVAAGMLLLVVFAVELRAESPAGDQMLGMLPAESLFVVRVNNFEYTISQVDQYLAGVSPMPMGLAMLVRMQFANVLGSPELNGVNMNGNFAIFGVIEPGQSAEPDPTNVFVGIFVPITDYQRFVSGNANVSPPDANGISKIAGSAVFTALAKRVGSYLLITSASNYKGLIAMAKSILVAKGSVGGLVGALDADEAKRAVKEPLWTYGNIQEVSRSFGPLIFGKLEQFKKKLESMKSSEQVTVGNPTAIVNMYIGTLEMLMKETQFLSITVNPRPDVLTITNTISAVPATKMANMFVAAPGMGQESKLLGYLEDGAAMNFGANINKAFMNQICECGFDLMTAVCGDIPADEMDKMKTLMRDKISATGDSMAFSFMAGTQGKPPFACKYVVELEDADKFDRIFSEQMKALNTGSFTAIYDNMGMKMDFAMKRAIDSYKGTAINSIKLTLKSTDPNSPQGQMINAMYGDGIDYRWAIVDRLCVFAFFGDVDSAVRELIDTAKAGGPKQTAIEMKAALALLAGADKADFVGTFNFLRLFRMGMAMATAIVPVPMPQTDIATKSNIAFAGKIGGGRMTVEVAIPKEHLMEIMTVVQSLQQKLMPQQPTVQDSNSPDVEKGNF